MVTRDLNKVRQYYLCLVATHQATSACEPFVDELSLALIENASDRDPLRPKNLLRAVSDQG